jgi:hypothetical protein
VVVAAVVVVAVVARAWWQPSGPESVSAWLWQSRLMRASAGEWGSAR